MPTLYCEAGHNWERPSQRGRRPRLCPEHSDIVLVGRRIDPIERALSDSAAIAVIDDPIIVKPGDCPCKDSDADRLTLSQLALYGSGCTSTVIVDMGPGKRALLVGGGYVCPRLDALRRRVA